MPKFEVVESTTIAAELGHIRGIVRDFRQWESWSPWLSAEPNCPLEYAADGNSYSWDGKVVGSGRMELVREEETAIYYKLTFLKPWKSESTVDFQFAKKGQETQVTWRMQGALPFFMFWMKKMMRGWVGADYRRGLAKLKDFAESGTVPSRTEFPGVQQGVVSHYVGLRSQCKIHDLGADMPPLYEKLNKWIEKNDTNASGKPLTIYHKFDIANATADYTAAIPVDKVPTALPPGFTSGKLNAPRSYQIRHTGAYRHLGNAWSAGMMHERSKAFRRNKACDPFEVYVTDPSSGVDEDQLVTEIHIPAR